LQRLLLCQVRNGEETDMKKLILIGFAATMCAAPAAAAPPTITLRAAPTVLSYGGATTLSGTLSTARR
jgi:hypothetical protein